MKRIIIATLPGTMLLLASCSWMYPTPKSDLRMAMQAATIAGVDDVTARTDPIELVPANAKSSTHSAAITTGTKPLIILPSVKSVTLPATTPAIAPQNVAVQDTVAKAPAEGTPAGEATHIGADTALAIVQPLAAGPVAEPTTASADIDAADIGTTNIGTKVPANGTAIHLASYREIGSAKRGWQILSSSYKELVPLKPLYVAVDVPGKGHVLRLYGTGTDAAALKTICTEMHAQGAYCAANIAF